MPLFFKVRLFTKLRLLPDTAGLPLREESAEVSRRDTARVCYIKQYLAQLRRDS